MRVLAGGPARETESEMFRLHVEGLRAQRANWGVARVHDEEEVAVVQGGSHFDLTIRHELVPDDNGPRWHAAKIERVAKVRQGFLDAVVCACGCGHDPMWRGLGSCRVRECPEGRTEPVDALLMVDTDVILGPGVLERMWQVDADVVYGVFFTRADWGNAPGIDLWPNCWDCHPYRFTEECWNELTRPGVNEVEVLGGGACTLIRGRGFESRYWPLLESIRFAGGMWGGEDRAFNLGLECRGIRQVAVTGLPIVHLYTEAHRTPEMVAEARERVGLFARVPD